jgi:alpha-beta hydrolase superfamily lysophospholipase
LEAYFFGGNARQLFGAFHEASGSGEHGVVLAYPGPQEYMQSHYAFRLLAAQLAREGRSVLRFDWSGTGDSAGDSDSVNFQQWREDLQLAVQELKDVSNARKISIVGFRLGATIAASTPFKQPVEELVLWEPVIHGHSYLEELSARGRRRFGDLLEPPPWWRQGHSNELLGQAISRAHQAEIEALDLAQQAVSSAGRLSVITHKMTSQQQGLLTSLKERGVKAELEEVEDADAYVHDDGMLLAGPTIARIAGKLTTV